MKHLFFTLAILLVHCVQAQNPAKIFAPNYYREAFGFYPLPTVWGSTAPENGYFSNFVAKHAQNIQVNNQGKIMFFIIDGYVFDRKGKFINNLALNYGQGTVGEITVIPNPGCEFGNEYIIISTGDYTTFGRRCSYDKLTIAYDENDNLALGSGLLSEEIFNSNSSAITISPDDLFFDKIVGPDFYGNNPTYLHCSNPYIAASKLNASNKRFVYIYNQARIFRFSIVNNQFTYDNYFLELTTLFPTYGIIVCEGLRRREMELITLSNGDMRLAFVSNTGYQDPSLPGTTLFSLDFSGTTGNYITSSKKSFTYQAPDAVDVNGIELSPDGSKLYASHNSTNNYASTLDYFNLNNTTLSRIVLSSNSDFSHSQIETGKSGGAAVLFIPGQNMLFQITFPNTTSPLLANAVTLSNYNVTYPYLNNIVEYARLMQDQIDDENYALNLPQEYDVISYTANTSATWTVSSNPFGKPVVNVKEELRIPKGIEITINPMTFNFAPGGRTVVEHGNGTINGGRLLLQRGTKFSSYNVCVAQDMWKGIEVWGITNQSQGTLSSSKQGFLSVSSSNIENAYDGAQTIKRDIDYTLNGAIYVLDLNGYGGIIRTQSAIFENNQCDIRITDYLPSGTSANLCEIDATTFTTSSLLKKPTLYTAEHVYLRKVRGINIYKSTFKNDATSLYSLDKQGNGVRAIDANFTIRSNVSGQVSTFQNLNTGVSAISQQLSLTHSISNCNFIDNIYGVSVQNVNNNQIFSNYFELRRFSKTGVFTQSGGLLIYNSTGYGIDGNRFYVSTSIPAPFNPATTHGIVVKNSGTGSNKIYKNTFENLDFGGQSEENNGQIASGFPAVFSTGLEWKCNTFINVMTHDLFVKNGQVRFFQGDIVIPSGLTNSEAIKYAANNRFSTVNVAPDNHIRLENSNNQMSYIHLLNSYYTPTSYTPVVPGINGVYLAPFSYNGAQLYADGNECPSMLHLFPIIFYPKMQEIRIELAEAEEKLMNSSEKELNYKDYAANYGRLLTEVNLKEDEILRALLLDSLFEEDKYLNFLSTIYSKEKGEKLRFDYLLNKGDLVDASNVLTENEFSAEYVEFSNLLISLRFENNLAEYLALDNDKTDKLMSLSHQENDIHIAKKAQELLNNNESIHYSFLMPNYTRSSSTTLLTENTQNSIHFKLFPNPANSSIRLQTISAEKVNARILIFDITGKVVDTKSMNRAELFIDIQALENGIYLVQITNNDTNEVETIRFVKH